MKLPVKEVGIHVNAEPSDGHDPYRILENSDGENTQYEDGFLPGALEESVLQDQTRNEQGQGRVDPATLFRNLDGDSGQGESEAVPEDWHSNDSEQAVAGCSGAPL